MMSKARRTLSLLLVGAVGVALYVIVLHVHGDEAARVSQAPRFAPPHAAMLAEQAAAAATELPRERHRYIVQSASTVAARSAVQSAGGVVTCDLSVIRAVGALLNERELAALRLQG